jgi:hypothetical protein
LLPQDFRRKTGFHFSEILLSSIGIGLFAKEAAMNIGAEHLQPIVSIVAGVLILIFPRLLNYVVAIFLILSGILGLR